MKEACSWESNLISGCVGQADFRQSGVTEEMVAGNRGATVEKHWRDTVLHMDDS